jgi:anion-transporting  ArsA/GET3 family ATPase
LDVAPTTPDLAGAEIELIDRDNRELAMHDAIAPIRDRYDYILIDCPPSLGLLTINMLAAADAVLIPVQCEYYALEGLSQLLNTVHRIQQSVNPRLAIDGVLLTMYDARLNLSRQVVTDAREYFGPKVFDTIIPRNVRLAEAPSFGKPIVLYDVASVGAQAYLSVAREIVQRHLPAQQPAQQSAQQSEQQSAEEAVAAANTDRHASVPDVGVQDAAIQKASVHVADQHASDQHASDQHASDQHAFVPEASVEPDAELHAVPASIPTTSPATNAEQQTKGQ